MSINSSTQIDKNKVLLVEDQENISKLFSYNLEKAGYECKVAQNGREGYDFAKKYKPDIIISDIMMPEVDGFNFRRLLLADSELSSIPFIFLTAKGDEEDILEGYDLEIEDYIIKTASAKIVLAKVNAILKSQQKERKKIVDEVHKAADKMVAKVVPDEFPKFDGYEIKHWHVSYEDVPGGDFIDYFQIDNNKMAIALGDVMGKKWGAWYFAVAYAGYVRSALRFVLQSDKNLSPGDIINKVNESVFKDERLSEVFVTLSLLICDNKENTVQYSGAGDLPLIYKSSETKFVLSHGLLLGFNETSEYENQLIQLRKGESLFLFTDGIIESRNSDGEQFEKERLLHVIDNTTDKNDILGIIKKEFTDFTNNRFEDDLSIVSIKKQ
jgi:sigma-B regulation protein RsbU (phosphoserine phosphatase)